MNDRAGFLDRAGWGVGLLAGAGLLLLAWYARSVLLVVFAGVLLGVILRWPGEWLHERTGLNPAIGVGLVSFVGLALLLGAFWLRGGAIASQAHELGRQLPQAIDRLRDQVSSTDWGQAILSRIPPGSELIPAGSAAFTRVSGFLSSTFAVVASAFVILFLALVMALFPRHYVPAVISLVPPARRDRATEVLHEVASTLRWWMFGRMLDMVVVGVLTLIGLWLLGIPLAFVLALIAALFTFVPNIGPIASAIPAILLGLMDSVTLALYVAALYSAVQVFDTWIMMPIVDKKTIYLPPAATITAQLLLGVFAGILGVALATPLLATGVVTVRMLYVEDRLETGEK